MLMQASRIAQEVVIRRREASLAMSLFLAMSAVAQERKLRMSQRVVSCIRMRSIEHRTALTVTKISTELNIMTRREMMLREEMAALKTGSAKTEAKNQDAIRNQGLSRVKTAVQRALKSKTGQMIFEWKTKAMNSKHEDHIEALKMGEARAKLEAKQKVNQ